MRRKTSSSHKGILLTNDTVCWIDIVGGTQSNERMFLLFLYSYYEFLSYSWQINVSFDSSLEPLFHKDFFVTHHPKCSPRRQLRDGVLETVIG